MLSEQIKQQALQLTQQLRQHNHAYYVLDNPQISDAEYDHLFQQLKTLEANYPELHKKSVVPHYRLLIALSIKYRCCLWEMYLTKMN